MLLTELVTVATVPRVEPIAARRVVIVCTRKSVIAHKRRSRNTGGTLSVCSVEYRGGVVFRRASPPECPAVERNWKNIGKADGYGSSQ